MTHLSDVLGVVPGITAVVGGGGKTSLIWRLSGELMARGRVLIATTTHIIPPACETLLSPTREEVRNAWAHTGRLAIGDKTLEGKLAPVASLQNQYQGLADYVLIEADGSRGLPIKAPAAYEPVFPFGVQHVIAIAGMACCGQTIAQAAHRPALYAGLVDASIDAGVTATMVAKVLEHPMGQRKGVTTRFGIVLNQADTPQRLAFAREVASQLTVDTVITALQNKSDGWELWRQGRRVSTML